MSVGMNLLAMFTSDTRTQGLGASLGAADDAASAKGSGSFAGLLQGELGEEFQTMLDELPAEEREELLAAMAQLALGGDGKELPPAVNQLLESLPDMPELSADEALQLQEGGEAALDVLATLVPEWRQWLSDAAEDVDLARLQAAVAEVPDVLEDAQALAADVAATLEQADTAEDAAAALTEAGEAVADDAVLLAGMAAQAAAAGQAAAMTEGAGEGDAQSLNRARFSLAQILGNAQAATEEAGKGRDSAALQEGESDKRSLLGQNTDEFAGLRRKAALEQNAASNPRLAEAALRAEPASRRTGAEEATEAARITQPGSAAAAAALTARPVSAPAQALGVPFGQAGWSEAVMDKVMWMSSRNLSSVEIRLTPAELGPLEINLQNRGQEIQVQFVSQNPSVREALESQVMRLREMVNEQGLDLVDVSVGDSGVGQQQERAEREAARAAGSMLAGGAADEAGDSLQAPVLPVAGPSERLVDYYA